MSRRRSLPLDEFLRSGAAVESLYEWARSFGCRYVLPLGIPVEQRGWRLLAPDEDIWPGDVEDRAGRRFIFTRRSSPVGERRRVLRRAFLPRTTPWDLTSALRGPHAEAERGLAEIRRRRAARAAATCSRSLT